MSSCRCGRVLVFIGTRLQDNMAEPVYEPCRCIEDQIDKLIEKTKRQVEAAKEHATTIAILAELKKEPGKRLVCQGCSFIHRSENRI